METIAFVQGVLSVIGVMVVGGMVWATLKINSMKHQIEVLENGLNRYVDILEDRIKDEVNTMHNLTDELGREINEVHRDLMSLIESRNEDVRRELYDVRNELVSQLDSRYDKLINQIKN